MNLQRRAIAAAWAGILCCAAPAEAAVLNVFAAASLSDALKQIAAEYERTSSDRIRFNFAASSFLQRQIEEGAPANIFFSADEAKMDLLERKELIEPGTRRKPLSNLLAVVVAAETSQVIRSPKDLAGPAVKRIALADPKTVPAGIYARLYFERAGLWEKVRPKVVPTDNVRAALAAVESGNVDAAVVYQSDVSISTKVKVAWIVPKEEGPDIIYTMAMVRSTKEKQAARKFLAHLESDQAGQVFEKFGLIVRRAGKP